MGFDTEFALNLEVVGEREEEKKKKSEKNADVGTQRRSSPHFLAFNSIKTNLDILILFTLLD
jgi:hypothetical protein